MELTSLESESLQTPHGSFLLPGKQCYTLEPDGAIRIVCGTTSVAIRYSQEDGCTTILAGDYRQLHVAETIPDCRKDESVYD